MSRKAGRRSRGRLRVDDGVYLDKSLLLAVSTFLGGCNVASGGMATIDPPSLQMNEPPEHSILEDLGPHYVLSRGYAPPTESPAPTAENSSEAKGNVEGNSPLKNKQPFRLSPTNDYYFQVLPEQPPGSGANSSSKSVGQVPYLRVPYLAVVEGYRGKPEHEQHGTTTISDSRLKRDLRFLGVLANGLPVYAFRYLWGGPRYVGVMAQDVLNVQPKAVTTDAWGFYGVNYPMLGLRMAVAA